MKLHITFNEINSDIHTQFIQTHCTFQTDFGEIILVKSDDVYTGDYDVIPRVYQQILETKDKVMNDDVTVEEIPIAKVLNLSGGLTATIG